MGKRSKPRILALVRFVAPSKVTGKRAPRYPFKIGEVYAFLGEIPNMPDHCVVVSVRSGKIYTGYHSTNFLELSESET
jgi:hypothetical protein